jgi:hypothetical protein
MTTTQGPDRDEQVPDYLAALSLPGLADVHVHFLPESLQRRVWAFFDDAERNYGLAWPITYRLDESTRLAILRGLGLRAVPALTYAHRSGMARWLNEWGRQFAERVEGGVHCATLYPEPGVGDYVAAAVAGGARLFKVHVQVGGFAPDDPRLDEAWEVLAGAGIPVVIHCGSGPLAGPHTGPKPISRLLARHPHLVLVIAHLGMPEYDEFADLAEAHAGVHLDTTMCGTDFANRVAPCPTPTSSGWRVWSTRWCWVRISRASPTRTRTSSRHWPASGSGTSGCARCCGPTEPGFSVLRRDRREPGDELARYVISAGMHPIRCICERWGWVRRGARGTLRRSRQEPWGSVMRRKLRAVLFTFLAIGMGWAGSPAARAATDDLGPGAAPAATVSSWPQFARAPDHPNTAPAETAFTPDSVSRLGVAWTGQFGVSVSTLGQGGAAVVGGLAYVGGTDGVLSVFRVADCAGGSCTPAWRGVTGGGIFNTPAVAGGLVLVGSTDHFVYAFPASGCGATTCPPRWRGRMADAPLYSSIAVAGGVAYIGDAGGRLYAFPVQGCGRATCTPSWVGRAGANEQLNTAPAVAGGFVYVGSFLSTPDLTSGRLLAFRATGCGSAACRPTWTADLLGPSDTIQAPLVSGGVVFASSSTRFGVDPDTGLHVFAFAAGGCGAAVCRPLRAYETGDGGVAGGLALSGGTLFASLQASPDPNTIGVVAAYPAAGCGRATCPPGGPA